MDIVKLIKQKCLERDITTRDLERHFGYSNGYIQTLKKPMRNIERAKEIAKFLDIPLSDLLNYGESEVSLPPETPDFKPVMDFIAKDYGQGTADAIKMLLELNPEDRAEIRGEMRAMLRNREKV